MHCFTELTASAAVTHSISIRLLSATATNLVVIKTNLLQVFTIQQETHSSGSNELSNGHQGSGFRTHLVLEHESDLYETVCALSASSLGRSEGAQALVVAFKDAKFAILGWDFYRHKLITRSIHYYEQDTLQGGPLAAITNYPSCYTIVDPQNRCLALVFGQRNVAFLPFRDEEDDGDGGLVNGDGESALQQLISPRTPRLPNGARQARASPYKPSFVLSLTSLDTAIRQPIHLDYLYEYREPTLGILYSQSQRSTALAAQHLDLLHFTVVSLDTDQRESQSIISVHGLPNDLHHVLSLPPPVAGALLVGDNEVIHVDQSAKTHGVAVNSAAKLTTSFSLSDQAYLELMLEDCQACVLPGPNGDVLLELRSGHSAIVSFVMDGRAVSGVKVRSISQYNDSWRSPSSASSLTAIRDDLVFRGSQTADSVLLSYDRKPRQSRLRAHPDDDVDGELELDDELDVDDELYSEATADMQQSGNLTRIDTAQAPGGEYIFKPQSSLENPGTLRQVAFGKGTSKTNAQSGLVTALLHGAANRSQLSLLSKQARLQLVAPALQTSAQRLWILSNGDASSSKSKSTSGSHQYCLLSSPSTDDVTSGETLLYEKQEDRFVAKADTEFEGAAGISIEVGVMGNGSRVVQVLADEVRIYDQGESTALLCSFLDRLCSLPCAFIPLSRLSRSWAGGLYAGKEVLHRCWGSGRSRDISCKLRSIIGYQSNQERSYCQPLLPTCSTSCSLHLRTIDTFLYIYTTPAIPAMLLPQFRALLTDPRL